MWLALAAITLAAAIEFAFTLNVQDLSISSLMA